MVKQRGDIKYLNDSQYILNAEFFLFEEKKF